jgi:hypothetical protein
MEKESDLGVVKDGSLSILIDSASALRCHSVPALVDLQCADTG